MGAGIGLAVAVQVLTATVAEDDTSWWVETQTATTAAVAPEVAAPTPQTSLEVESDTDWMTDLSEEASSGISWDLGGRVTSNIRYRPDNKSTGAFYNRFDQPPRLVRNEHILKLKANARAGRVRGVVDVDIVWTGYPRPDTLEDLSVRDVIEPTRLEAHALYAEVSDLFVDGLDLRVGQQIVSWGMADQFNPTNTFNADDLEDRLLFGVQQGNLMARADYAPSDAFTLSGVLIPLFKPALLPRSAAVALKGVDRLPMRDRDLRARLHSDRATAELFGYPTIVDQTQIDVPEASLKNMQGGLRLATNVFDTDVALSYYVGRSDIPVPLGNFTEQLANGRCNPDDGTDCIDGLLSTSVRLGYPHINVLGLNLAGEIPLPGDLLPIGFRFEMGVYFPSEVRMAVQQSDITLLGITIDAGEYDYDGDGAPGGGERPVVLPSTPYAKWTLGFDYSIGKHVYLNAMWAHGLADELGAGDFFSEGQSVRGGGVVDRGDETLDRAFSCSRLEKDGSKCARETLRNNIGDYVVLGADFKFSGDSGLFRLFAIWDVTGYSDTRYSMSQDMQVEEKHSPFSGDGFSLVLYPELDYNFGGGFELGIGALLQLGRRHTKFGDPAAGGSLLWTRARWAF